MTVRCWVSLILASSLLSISALACSGRQPTQSVQTPLPSSAPPVSPEKELPTRAPTLLPLTTTPALRPVTSTPMLDTVTAGATIPVSGSGITEVQFALDVDETGQLIFPATEFVFGVTRIYLRFAYQGLEDVKEVETIWYLNENRVSSGKLAWDGGDAGEYLIWVEDPIGLGRGQWRWELVADGVSLGGGAFAIGGEPRYLNELWGLSLDPPATWEIASERSDFVTFSSPDRRQALALHVSPEAAELAETSAAELALFREDHPDADVEATDEVTMGGERALAQHVRYTDQERGEQYLIIVSALHGGAAYNLWMLGPADDAATIVPTLFRILHSIRFLVKE